MKDWSIMIGFLALLWVVTIVLILSYAVLDRAYSDSIICTQAAGPNHTGKITCK